MAGDSWLWFTAFAERFKNSKRERERECVLRKRVS